MILNKLLKKAYAGVIVLSGITLALSSCQGGLTYEDAPESVYSKVGANRLDVRARELFQNKIYAINWNQWVENYLNTQLIGNTGTSWTNNTGVAVTLSNGSIVQPGAKVTGGITQEDNADAPDGKLYVMTVYAQDHATYKTANKGYLFDGSKFTGDFKLGDPITNNRSETVKLPVRKNEIICEMVLDDAFNCVVERVGDAPALGEPGDFSTPKRYLVKNIAYLPKGVQQYKRLYEVRVVFYPF